MVQRFTRELGDNSFAYQDFPTLDLTSRSQVRHAEVSIYYQDINNTIGLGLNNSHRLIVYDDNAISRQISNILGTPLWTDDFVPTFGSLLPYRLMDGVTRMNAHLIYADTIEAMAIWMEDKIQVIEHATSVDLFGGDADNQGFSIDMPYLIKKTQIRGRYHASLLK